MKPEYMTQEQLVSLVRQITDIVNEKEVCDNSNEATERDLNKYDRIEACVSGACEGDGMVPSYMVIRKFQNGNDELILQGLSLQEAKAHCSDNENSSRTCTSQEGSARTELHGNWFDCYYEE